MTETLIKGFNYVPSPTGIKFHESDAVVKLVVGPFGSGKTCMIMNDALFYCLSQAPAPDGVRYSCIGVVRGTYPELVSTTRPSIEEVFPAQFGSIRMGGSPLRGTYRFPVGDGPYDYVAEGRAWQPGDGTWVQADFVLQALQSAQDTDKIRSANWSFAIINEATSVDYEVVAAVLGRIGRFPSQDMGGCSYAGLLIDSNQPPPGHFLLDMMAHPEPNWLVLKQPPAAFKQVSSEGDVHYELNTGAENLRNLGAKRKPDDFDTWSKDKQEEFLRQKGLDYYGNQIKAWELEGRQDKIDSLFCMLDVPMRDGKPVFPLFNMDLHVARAELAPVPYHTTIIGYDTSGVHPACVFMQEQNGKWMVTDEIYGDGLGMEAFLEQALLPLIASRYANCDIVVSCDPANARDSYTGLSPAEHLRARGLNVVMPATNSPKTRVNAVDNLLNKNVGGLLISPQCAVLIRAMQGGYRYRRLRVTGTYENIYDAKPEKNSYSHIADALQYACLYIVREHVENDADGAEIKKTLGQRRAVLRRVM